MAAGLGFKTFTTGEVLTAADTNGYLMQGINVFASSAARAAAITSPQEGQYSFLKDTNALEYYDGAAWVGAPVGDITAVTAGKGLTGGGSSGDVTVSLATTAKGDLVVGTGASTAGVLSVSSDGSTIVADSSTSTGLRYQEPKATNPVLNSAMQIWQRGTSIAVSTLTYTADRWEAYRFVAGSTVSRQVTGDTTNLPNIQYCARVQRNSGNTATDQIWFSQSFETVNTIPFVGKTITLSYYARAGANYSSTGNSMSVLLFTGTGTDQNITGYTGSAATLNTSSTLTTTWQRFSQTVTIPTTTTEMGIQFRHTGPTGTAGTNDYFEVTGIQLEVGSVATPFKTYAGTIQGELAACQRYYWRTGTVTTGDQLGGSWGYGCTGSYARFLIKPPVTMRVPPTSTDYSAVDLTDPPVGTLTGTTITSQTYTADAIQFVLSSSGTVNARYMYYTTARSSASYLGFSAEL